MNIEILKRFCCDPKEGRSNIENPFSIGEFTYATNGKIIVRVPKIFEAPERADAPSTAANLFDDFKGTDFQPVEFVMPEIERNLCTRCLGKKRFDLCSDCDGTGAHQCDCGHQHDCRHCNGKGMTFSESGEFYCKKCNGSGEVEMTPIFKIGAAQFNAWFIEKIVHSFINVKFCVPGEKDVCGFKFDGGEGLIMPLQF